MELQRARVPRIAADGAAAACLRYEEGLALSPVLRDRCADAGRTAVAIALVQAKGDLSMDVTAPNRGRRLVTSTSHGQGGSQAEPGKPVTYRRLAAAELGRDVPCRRAALDQVSEHRLLDRPLRRVAGGVRGHESVLVDPVRDGRGTPAGRFGNRLEGSPGRQLLLQPFPLHEANVVRPPDGTRRLSGSSCGSRRAPVDAPRRGPTADLGRRARRRCRVRGARGRA